MSCSFAGFPIVNIAWIFSGFASIPLADTRNPRSCPADTPKEHFVGVKLEFVPVEVVEGFLQVADQRFLLSCGDDHVIDVDLDVAAYLTSEAVLHHPLISCSYIF
jgi:hypothetical protein